MWTAISMSIFNWFYKKISRDKGLCKKTWAQTEIGAYEFYILYLKNYMLFLFFGRRDVMSSWTVFIEDSNENNIW